MLRRGRHLVMVVVVVSSNSGSREHGDGSRDGRRHGSSQQRIRPQVARQPVPRRHRVRRGGRDHRPAVEPEVGRKLVRETRRTGEGGHPERVVVVVREGRRVVLVQVVLDGGLVGRVDAEVVEETGRGGRGRALVVVARDRLVRGRGRVQRLVVVRRVVAHRRREVHAVLEKQRHLATDRRVTRPSLVLHGCSELRTRRMYWTIHKTLEFNRT